MLRSPYRVSIAERGPCMNVSVSARRIGIYFVSVERSPLWRFLDSPRSSFVVARRYYGTTATERPDRRCCFLRKTVRSTLSGVGWQ